MIVHEIDQQSFYFDALNHKEETTKENRVVKNYPLLNIKKTRYKS